MSPPAFRNTILQHLTPGIVKRLDLKPIDLAVNTNLEIIGEPIRHLYFLEEGVGSMTTAFANGSEVEVTMFGYESIAGVSALMGTKHSLNRVFMQISGHGYACTVKHAVDEFQRHGQFHALALRYVQAQLVQSMQNAACNAMHRYEQRLARWLLICSDRANDTTLHLSQEFVAMMLGTRRTTVALAMGVLKKKGLIEQRRGAVHLLDMPGLEQQACECFLVVKEHLANFAEFDTSYVV